ncbi:MAG: gamma-glutamyl-gamma-aminobutyrate hydrolase family protein [bacterium]|nr:gamma-glutamyl-gamma-aminobutyrate hydrolase family protein [bacterium]
MKRPKIAVTGPVKGGAMAWLFISNQLRFQGAHPVRLTSQNRPKLEGFDGLIISGGADIDPGLYPQGEGLLTAAKKQAEQPKSHWLRFAVGALVYGLRRLAGIKQGAGYDAGRDSLEKMLIEQALQQGVPLLGICRGMQLINVVSGGSLYGNLVDHFEQVNHPRTVLPRMYVHLEPDSRLAEVVQTQRLKVNALHHQSVKDLGQSLRVVARTEAGIVQAIERPQGPFVLGLQWHPEYMPQVDLQRALFAEFVRQAKKYAAADQKTA